MTSPAVQDRIQISPELADGLRVRFGERCTSATTVLEQHAHDESHHQTSAPDLVVFARSTEDVVDVVRLCAGHRCPVVAFGAGTSLEGNVNAVAGGVTIDLSEMNRILHVNPEDGDVTVQAGVRRKQLNTELRDTGLFFPIDPGPDATLGGMASTRASGTNAVRYGTMREAVLSLTVVLADGTVVRTARRARKSAAGYDLTRLFIGQEGTLGIITELTVRLHGIPESVTVARCTFPTVANAVDTAIRSIQAGVPVARVELLDDRMMDAINRFSKTNLPVAPTLFFELHGSPAGVAEQMEMVEAIAAEHEGQGFVQATTTEERAVLWQARHDAYYAAVSARPNAKGWATDVCVPISALTQCIEETRADLDACPVPACIVGHVGDGNFHVVFSVLPENPGEHDAIHEISRRLSERAIRLDGTCTGEHGVGLGKQGYMEAEFGTGLEVMRLLKRTLDPENLLNPGKIFQLDAASPERFVSIRP